MLSESLARFDILVLCAEELQPSSRHFPYTTVLRCPLRDDPNGLKKQQARMVIRTAQTVARAVRSGRRCLVTCNAGLNRSGLVTATALHLLTGYSGFECVSIVQERRPGALFNEAFVDELYGLRATRSFAA